MRDVKSLIITRYVAVLQVILAILLSDAYKKNVSLTLYILTFKNIHNNIALGKPEPLPPVNPCIPSPCGPNSHCRLIENIPACSCAQNFVGRPPNCRPECTINAECAANLACQNERCVDPCPGSCGSNTECTVISHRPVCSCRSGHTGDPFSGCIVIPSKSEITNNLRTKH